MSIFSFARKHDSEQESGPDGNAVGGLGHPYGIDNAIQLLRSLPRDQSDEVIVGVVGATLESLNVHLADIIEDATRKEELTRERIAAVNSQVGELEKQVVELRIEIAALTTDLNETTDAKERLQRAEKHIGGHRRLPLRDELTQTLSYGRPPPLSSDISRPAG